MSVLVIYDAQSTHVNAVYQHLVMLSDMSGFVHHFLHCGEAQNPDLSGYDVVVIHYSARLVTDVVSPQLIEQLAGWSGVKVLFVQDEYDLTETLRGAITRIGFNIVYTCVPEEQRSYIYPPERFPMTQFITTMTGFAPDPELSTGLRPLADRPIWVGYRGRALPYWYGDLGQEKQKIAVQMRDACVQAGIPHDIAWTEEKRIYGAAWPAFLQSCRATLGTESGSNIFDDDGSIRVAFQRYARLHPNADYMTARGAVLGKLEEKTLMNQVSPRIFEAVAAGTALILYEGSYSQVVRADSHFIALRKDGRNMQDVLRQLGDTQALTHMVARAWDDVILNGRFSARRFMAEYDSVLARMGVLRSQQRLSPRSPITLSPLRYAHVNPPYGLAAVWRSLPAPLRRRVALPVRRIIGGLRRLKRSD